MSSRMGYGRLSRRGFIGLAGLAGAAALGGSADYVIDRALLSDPGPGGSLGDIDHIVLLMLENRSFDHYFGTMSGVRGYDDMTRSRARQHYAGGTLMPFHLDTRRYASLDPDVLNDPSHSWQTQHASWNRGAMNDWMTAHVAADGPKVASDAMGYYTRSEVSAMSRDLRRDRTCLRIIDWLMPSPFAITISRPCSARRRPTACIG